jgi:hypothetical protein
MAGDENQRSIFDFLTAHLDSQEPFTKQQLEQTTTWHGDTFRTYWSKQLAQFFTQLPNNKYRVTESFRPFTNWDKFRLHVTQVRRVAADYKKTAGNVLTFEFFMPLSNENHLKTTLDALFYKDTILAKLKSKEDTELHKHFLNKPNEERQSYLDRLCGWISPRFVGYSITHVNGRFRAEPLCTQQEASRFRGRYLVDETTAVTRFIFPCEDEREADQIRWFFELLFVDSIIQVVNGEAEIWMIESGLKNRLHIWRVESD